MRPVCDDPRSPSLPRFPSCRLVCKMPPRSLCPALSRLDQPSRHLFVLRCDSCPALGGSVPPVITDRHINTPVDEELHGFVVFVPHQLMQNASGLMRTPARVDIGPLPEKKVGDLEVVV